MKKLLLKLGVDIKDNISPLLIFDIIIVDNISDVNLNINSCSFIFIFK